MSCIESFAELQLLSDDWDSRPIAVLLLFTVVSFCTSTYTVARLDISVENTASLYVEFTPALEAHCMRLSEGL